MTTRWLACLMGLVVLSACTPDAAAPLPEPAQTEPSSPAATTPTGTSPPPRETTAPPCDDVLGCYGEPRRIGQFDAELIPGASGLAASRRNPGVLYVLDDRPGTAEVWAVTVDGEMLGAIPVPGLEALDTEALALGACGPGEETVCVYVGDIGDNLRSRASITVHRFPEPDLSDGVPPSPPESAMIRLTYPADSADAEALLVDGDGVPHLITKAPFDPERRVTGEARLYRAPGWRDGELEDLGVLPVPAPAEPLHSELVGNVVTGADHLPGRVIVRTYDQVLEYVADDGAQPLSTMPSWEVVQRPSPFEMQSEAIAWAGDGCGYYTVGEQVGDIWFVTCRP